jgi:hypothetical protein
MATLYDLAMQYLNQSLPKTFKYDRTNPPTIGPRLPVQPEDPNAPVKRILPVQGGGGDGFSVYNSDPNRTRTQDNYLERPYKSTVYNDAFPMMGDPIANKATGALNADGLMSYAGDKQLKGIPGAAANYLKNSFIGKGLEYLGDKMPVNQRAIYENELLGQGIMLDDIGRIVSDGGDINTAENIMAGYNANKVTAETFQKRREMIKDKMSDKVNPKTGKTFKQEKLDALDGAEAKMLGTAKTRADMVFDDKSLAKDPSYKNFDQKVTEGLLAGDEGDDLSEIPQDKLADIYPQSFKADTFDDKVGSSNQFTYPIGPDGLEMDNVRTIVRNPNYSGNIDIPFGGTVLEDEEEYLDYTNPNIYNTKSIYTSVPTSTYDEAGKQLGGDGTGSVGSYDDSYINEQIDRDIINRGGGDNISSGGLNNSNRESIIDRGSSGDPNSGPITQTTKPGELKTSTYDSEGEDDADVGKIVCTMMNEFYGFGSFRNKIWLKHSKGLAPEYQKGYHKLFLPLVKIAKTNKVVRKILEHIAVHRTIDIRQESRGKVHLLGRVYRKILEPICYFVGKHG